MRKNRLLLSLTFALTCGAVACGGADDSSLSDSTESLRRGGGDGGVKAGRGHGRDSDADVDEDTDEAARGDGGRGHDRVSHERGDGGQCSRGAGHHVPGRGGDQGQGRGRDEDQDDEQDEENDSEDGKGGLSGPKLDGGGPRGGKPGHDAGVR
ncbi:MAG: hypothetical protein RLZZ450_6913 [Pseudomonadota bacterium]|jgi:hypothetical protein